MYFVENKRLLLPHPYQQISLLKTGEPGPQRTWPWARSGFSHRNIFMMFQKANNCQSGHHQTEALQLTEFQAFGKWFWGCSRKAWSPMPRPEGLLLPISKLRAWHVSPNLNPSHTHTPTHTHTQCKAKGVLKWLGFTHVFVPWVDSGSLVCRYNAVTLSKMSPIWQAFTIACSSIMHAYLKWSFQWFPHVPEGWPAILFYSPSGTPPLWWAH